MTLSPLGLERKGVEIGVLGIALSGIEPTVFLLCHFAFCFVEFC